KAAPPQPYRGARRRRRFPVLPVCGGCPTRTQPAGRPWFPAGTLQVHDTRQMICVPICVNGLHSPDAPHLTSRVTRPGTFHALALTAIAVGLTVGTVGFTQGSDPSAYVSAGDWRQW